MAGDAGKRKSWHVDGRNGKNKKQRLSAVSAKGFAGILCTCDKTKERVAVKEAMNLLNEFADKFYPVEEEEQQASSPKEEDETATKTKSISESLQEEIQQLKEASSSTSKGNKAARFMSLDTGVKGLFLIRIVDDKISAVELVKKIFEQISSTKESMSRFIARMIPLEMICYPSVEDITKAVKPIIDAHFNGKKGIKYSVEIKKRNCNTLKSMDVINACVELVGVEHVVNLTEPDAVIIVEIFRNVCGVSLVTNFHKVKKYSLRNLLQPSEPKPTLEKAEQPTKSAAITEAGNKEAKTDC